MKDVFKNNSEMDINIHQLIFLEAVLEEQRKTGSLNEVLEEYRVNKHKEELKENPNIYLYEIIGTSRHTENNEELMNEVV